MSKNQLMISENFTTNFINWKKRLQSSNSAKIANDEKYVLLDFEFEEKVLKQKQTRLL